MGGRSSGCRASSSGERIGESTITVPPSVSPYRDATFIVIKPPKLWPMTNGRSPSCAAAITARISSARLRQLSCLRHPLSHMPRPAYKTANFREGVEKLEDLKPGMVLDGVVTNVAAFGAFVDVGVHHDGLVHISAM